MLKNDALSIEEVVDHPYRQQLLSSKLEAAKFNQLIDNSSAADKARLMSVSSVHASSWLLATPSPGLGLHLDPEEIQELYSRSMHWLQPYSLKLWKVMCPNGCGGMWSMG